MSYDLSLTVKILVGVLLFMLGFYLGQRKKRQPLKEESIWVTKSDRKGWATSEGSLPLTPSLPPPPPNFQRKKSALLMDDLYR